jgi:hypothetical protein
MTMIGFVQLKGERIIARDPAGKLGASAHAASVLIPATDADGDPCLVPLDPMDPAHLLIWARSQFPQLAAAPAKEGEEKGAEPSASVKPHTDKAKADTGWYAVNLE